MKASPSETIPVHSDNPRDAAKDAGLRYVRDNKPGIRRLSRGKTFRYVDPDGKTIRDEVTLARIRALAIPPAYTNVWICPFSNGHLQATGRDARGRKQYRYHPRWRIVRDETKYDRMIAFGSALPKLRSRLEADLALSGLPRPKVLATVVRLLSTSLIRVGNAEYARTNRSFGLTTLRNNHIKIEGATLHFVFRGKSGVRHCVDVTDRRLARVVRRCRDLPGQELFQYLDENGDAHAIDSADINDYLKEISGQEFTAKDFRTWAGTLLAARALREFAAFKSKKQATHNVIAAIETVAERLGNTVTVCRKCYVHPAVVQAYLDKSLEKLLCISSEQISPASVQDQDPEETAILEFLTSLNPDVGEQAAEKKSPGNKRKR